MKRSNNLNFFLSTFYHLNQLNSNNTTTRNRYDKYDNRINTSYEKNNNKTTQHKIPLLLKDLHITKLLYKPKHLRIKNTSLYKSTPTMPKEFNLSLTQYYQKQPNKLSSTEIYCAQNVFHQTFNNKLPIITSTTKAHLHSKTYSNRLPYNKL